MEELTLKELDDFLIKVATIEGVGIRRKLVILIKFLEKHKIVTKNDKSRNNN